MAGYNITRSVEDLLEKTESKPPSFSVHLYPEYWTLNNGSKFLYNNQVASLLDDIRAHRIPVDFLELFDTARVPFYDGCMIVELLDYRPQKTKEPTLEKPERTRVVLHPNSETLWADICLLNQRSGSKWTDVESLEVESRLLLATTPPLCLDPNPHLSRIVNHVLRVSTPSIPVSLKRKAVALDPEEDETDRVRRAKIMQFMNPRSNRSHTPSYRILDTIQRMKEGRTTADIQVPRPPSQPVMPPTATQSIPPTTAPVHVPTPTQAPTSLPNTVPTPIPVNGEDKPKQFKKLDASQPYAMSPVPFHPNSLNHSSPVSQSQSPMPHHSSPQVPPAQLQPRSNTPSQLQGSPVFQPSIPSAHFLKPPPNTGRNVQPKPTNGNSAPNTPQMSAQPNGSTQASHNQQMQMIMRMQRQNPAVQNQNGRSTPQGPPSSRSPMMSNATQVTARNSPLATNQPPTSRSPMPANSQPQMPQQHVNFSVPQNQYNPHLRPMMQTNGSPHPQNVPLHMANGIPQTMHPSPQPQAQPTQQEVQAHPPTMVTQYPHVFTYPQMGVNYALPPGRPGFAWGIGRGIPGVVNGQHQMMIPNGNHPQQMTLGVGKAVPGQLQGR